MKPKGKKPAGQKKSRLRILGLNIALMVAVAAVAVVVGWQWVVGYTHHGEEIGMPSVVGLPLSGAEFRLRELGLRPEVGDSVYEPKQAGGVVIEQSIKAGNRVKSGRIVRLTVNALAAPMIALPDIADNSSVREATMKLRALGFVVEEPEYCSGERDWVYEVKANGKSVYAYTKLRKGTRLRLVVGDGTVDETFVEEVDSLPLGEVFEPKEDQ